VRKGAVGGGQEEAEAKRMGSQSMHCVFFLKNACTKGSSCRFLHDHSLFDKVNGPLGGGARKPNAGGFSPASRSRPLCIFFQRGKCLKGEACPFSHGGDGLSGSDGGAAGDERPATWGPGAPPSARSGDHNKSNTNAGGEADERPSASAATTTTMTSSFGSAAGCYEAPGFGGAASGRSFAFGKAAAAAQFAFGFQKPAAGKPASPVQKVAVSVKSRPKAPAAPVATKKALNAGGQAGEEGKRTKPKHKKITWKSSSSSSSSSAMTASAKATKKALPAKRKQPSSPTKASPAPKTAAMRTSVLTVGKTFPKTFPKTTVAAATVAPASNKRAKRAAPQREQKQQKKQKEEEEEVRAPPVVAAAAAEDDFDKVLDEFDF